MVKNGDLSDIVCVTTSNRTTRQAQSLGFKVEEIDMLIILTLLLMGLMKSVIISKESRVAVRSPLGKDCLQLF